AKRDEFPYMYFIINHSSRGILTIQKEIDRDELCRLRRCRCDTWCDLELEILINSEQFNIELITIRILDRNDHKPTFTHNQLNLTIVEHAQIGAMIKLDAAIDQDQGNNSIIGYSIASSISLPFSLRYDLLRGDLSLVVEQILDREITSSYQFDIIARDGGNQTGTLHVSITITDINDCAPKFDQPIYILNNISETLPIGSIVSRVHAKDDDDGINGEINYHLINQDHCLEIDQVTGDIRVKCQLDYETKSTHRLEIEARDRGEGYKTDFCIVLVHIFDENDNSPMIDIYPPSKLDNTSNSIEIDLSESIPLHSLVLSLTIVDRDSGDNGRVTWKLLQSPSTIPFDLIRLSENTGEIRTKELLDRERIEMYNLTLEATDHGRSMSKSTFLNINIRILDENDNAPQFRQTNMTATINEHVKSTNSKGYDIYHLHAIDYDHGINGEIRYSIQNNDENLFQIDPKTGIIRAILEFDRKKQETYVIQVEARDQGKPSLSTQGTIIFTVISRNEYSPVCNVEQNITWTVRENSETGTVIGTISCRDDDKDELNGQISVYPHWLSQEKNDKQYQSDIPFAISTQKSNTSQSTTYIIISTNGTIDREKLSSYPLFLTVSDNGNPRQSINISITIEILDENDHCPQLHIESSFIIINRDLTPKDFLIHLIATDNDQDSNGNVTFELSPVTSPEYIHLLPNGTLIVQTDSDLILDNSLTVLHVQIRDQGEPTPCLIVETLRLFIGSNATDWITVVKNNNYDDTSLRLATEEFQQDKRMAHAYSVSPSLPLSSPLFQYPSSIASLATRKQMFGVFIGLSVLMFIVILTMVLCFIDCTQKKSKKNRAMSMLRSNGFSSHDSTSSTNGKYSLTPLPCEINNIYENGSTAHRYKGFKGMTNIKPVVILSSSTYSRSSSSIDSTTRANTEHNRARINTYTYTALSTSDDFMPIDFDDRLGSTYDENGIELRMTTV
ncbi:unnamed protein product, partial [Adineta ricciae]